MGLFDLISQALFPNTEDSKKTKFTNKFKKFTGYGNLYFDGSFINPKDGLLMKLLHKKLDKTKDDIALSTISRYPNDVRTLLENGAVSIKYQNEDYGVLISNEAYELIVKLVATLEEK